MLFDGRRQTAIKSRHLLIYGWRNILKRNLLTVCISSTRNSSVPLGQGKRPLQTHQNQLPGISVLEFLKTASSELSILSSAFILRTWAV